MAPGGCMVRVDAVEREPLRVRVIGLCQPIAVQAVLLRRRVEAVCSAAGGEEALDELADSEQPHEPRVVEAAELVAEQRRHVGRFASPVDRLELAPRPGGE